MSGFSVGFTWARPIRFTHEQMEQMLRTPQFRAKVIRILNNEAREVKAIAEELAEQDLRRRPPGRRTQDSKDHGKEYHDSFEIVPTREHANKMRVAISNSHPWAAAVEFGTRRHDIPKTGTTHMGFPYNGPSGKGSPGKRSGWLLEGDPKVHAYKVDHPGAGAFHIQARALRIYRRRHNGIINQRTQI